MFGWNKNTFQTLCQLWPPVFLETQIWGWSASHVEINVVLEGPENLEDLWTWTRLTTGSSATKTISLRLHSVVRCPALRTVQISFISDIIETTVFLETFSVALLSPISHHCPASELWRQIFCPNLSVFTLILPVSRISLRWAPVKGV